MAERAGDGTDVKRRRTSNARRNGKPHGQTGASGEKRATKRENGTGGAETTGGWPSTKRENGTEGAETSGGWRATKRENWHGRGRKRRADGARRNRKTGTGGGGNVGRMARDETGKLARAGAETTGGWRATKRENWHGRGGNH